MTDAESTLDRVNALLAQLEQGDAPVGTAEQVAALLGGLPADAESGALRVRAELASAALALLTGDAEDALTRFDRAAGLCTTDDLVQLGVSAQIDAATILIHSGALTEAHRRLDRATGDAQSGVAPAVALGLANAWTALAMRQGRPSTAFGWAEEAVRHGRTVGGSAATAALVNLAQVCAQIGDAARAGDLFRLVLTDPHRTTGDERTARFGLALLAPSDASGLIEAAQAAQAVQDAPLFVEACQAVGWAAQRSGQLDVARAWFATAAATTPDPAILATSTALIAATWTGVDPARAASIREQARQHARTTSAETRVAIDHFTALDAARDDPATALPELLVTALVMDTWRLDLPWGLARAVWQGAERARGSDIALDLAHRLGRHDLVAGLAAHRAATLTPEGDLPPRVTVAGLDPLAEAARLAVQRHGCPVRDEHTTVAALECPALDLIAVGTVLCWRRPDGLHSVRVDGAALAGPLAELLVAADAALTTPGSSALLDRESEAALMARLGALLLPEELLADLGTTLRIRADGDLAVLPWGLLALPGGDTRLIERTEVLTLAPFGVHGTSTQPGHGVVAVIDPRVPGVAADSPLGPVLGDHGGPLIARLRTHELVGSGEVATGRTDQDRTWLAEALAAGPVRLLYLGHAGTVRTADGRGSVPALHLSCTASEPGEAAPVGRHRPWTARDLLDTVPHCPERVALLACSSGDDARTRDAYGLSHAMLARGSRLVTALRWPLPTGQWYRDGGVRAEVDPLVRLTLAVDAAHESDDPVRVLGDWQREQLARWRADGALLDSPVGWAGVHTIV